MRRADFQYDLPPELIAQTPPPERGGGRLLVLDGSDGRVTDRQFADLPEYLKAGDLLVFNDTRVVRARLFARKESGGAVELLLEHVAQDARRGFFQAKSSKGLREGMVLQLEGGGRAVVLGRREEMVELEFEDEVLKYLGKHGHVPLPPYIKRTHLTPTLSPREAGGEGGRDDVDAERYQTVFARAEGAVAAPTAGLHFDRPMLDKLAAAGIQSAYVTLHVGAGTFRPVRVDDLDQHRMHYERVEVGADVCSAIVEARARGGRVIAVGTTVVRSLESACRDGVLAPFQGQTNLFIRPGYRFQTIDALVTNFHLPESTLLMLVSAFAGKEHVFAAYRHAVDQRYRFFSYGDAMFVTAAPR